MATLVNKTPHAVTFMLPDGETMTIPPTPPATRVASTDTVVGEICGVPVVRTTYGDVVNLPEPEPGVFYIVSGIVLAAVGDSRQDLLAPDTGPASAVRDDEDKIVGVRRLRR